MNAKKIQGFICETCKSFSTKQHEAETCCRCKCGEPVRRDATWHDTKCEKCRRKEWKRDAHARVRRLRKELASAEETLSEVIKEAQAR